MTTDRNDPLTPTLSHERLDVYQAALEFLDASAAHADGLPAKYAHSGDQLRRAALSVVLNIAEAVGKTSGADRKRFFAIARGSAAECGAVLDALRVLKLIDEDRFLAGKTLLVRIVSMLTRMCR